MTCTKCGQTLTGESLFCSRCGTPTAAAGAEAVVVDGPTFVPVQGSEVLDGKWRLEKKIGEGGMGAVYLAHDLQLERKTAIKILASSLAHDAELVARFEREARFTASLEHPNIVPIYAVGRFKNRPFMVMKHLEGEPLSATLRARGKLPLEEVLALTRQVCAGLDYIHSKGYVHRDIKAGNIFVSPHGLATILDFGILRPKRNAESLTRTGMVMGTPQYMSPEQALGEREIDHRSDLYALAVMVYECLSGALPFDSDSDLSIIQMQAHAAAPDLCERAPWVSRPVGDLVMRALSKRADERYQSAGELASAFEAAVSLQDMFMEGSSASISLAALPDAPAVLDFPARPPGVPATPPVAVRLTPVGTSGPKVAPARAVSGPKPVLAAVAPSGPKPAVRANLSGPHTAPSARMAQQMNGSAAALAPQPQPSFEPAPAALAEVAPEAAVDPSADELAVRRSRLPMVAAVAAVAILGSGAAYLALRSRPAAANDVPATQLAQAEPPPPAPAEPVAPPPPEPQAAAAAPEEPPAAEPSADDPPAPAPQLARSSGSAARNTGARRTAPGAPGQVNVITTFHGGPYWASIAVNGQSRGITPVLLELPAGKHQLRIERAGFKPIEKQVKVASGRSAVVRIELVP